MLHVKTRRRLAVALVAAFAVIAVAAARVTWSHYSPGAIDRQARKALGQLAGCDVSLGQAHLSTGGYVTFQKAAFLEDGRTVATADAIVISSLPRPWGDWQPGAIATGKWHASLDLGDPGKALSDCSRLVDLAHNIGKVIKKDAARSTFLPGAEAPAAFALEIDVKCPGVPLLRYAADEDDLFEKRLLRMSPRDGAAPQGWSFTATGEQIELQAAIDAAAEPLADLVAKKAGARLFDHIEDTSGGRFTALWTKDGESVRFATAGGWELAQSAPGSLGLTVPEGHLAVRVDAFAVKDGRLEALSGSLEFATEKITSGTLSRWLGALGLDAFGESNTPDYFENVHVAADFTIEDGVLCIRASEGKPTLVWAEVDGETIPLFSGSGEIALDDFRRKAAAIPAATPPTPKSPAETRRQDTPPQADAPVPATSAV
ncbi:MAG: hypothetical protein J7M19_06880 [Planctomycetes bacterium]|nr:hypothetical protein [Planctomycetota bacterium]